MPYYGGGGGTANLSGTATQLDISGSALTATVDANNTMILIGHGGIAFQSATNFVGFAKVLNFTGSAFATATISNNTGTITINSNPGPAGPTGTVNAFATVSGTMTWVSGGGLTGSSNFLYDPGYERLHISRSSVGDRPAFVVCSITGSESQVAVTDAGVFFSRRKARNLPMYMGPSGLDFAFQPMLALNKAQLWQAAGNGTTITQWGNANLTTSGTATTGGNVAVTNFSSSLRKVNYVGAATAGNGGALIGVLQFSRGINTGIAGVGQGFYAVFRGVLDSNTMAQSGTKFFAGMYGTAATIGATAVSGVLNSIGVMADALDTVYYFGTNDGAATATRVSTGISRSNGDVFDVRVFSPPSGSYIGISIDILTGTTGATVGTVDYIYSGTDMPATATLLAPQIYYTNGATAVAIRLGVISVYAESDW